MTRSSPKKQHAYGERRDALLDATMRLIAREGIRSLRYRSVAHEAGVAHPLIAHHFGSLDALLDAAMERSLQISADELVIAPEAEDPDDFGRGFLDGVDRLSTILVFQYHVMVETKGDEADRRLQRIHSFFRDAIRVALADIGCPTDDGLVELVYAALEGIVYHQLMQSGRDVNELALTRLRQLLGALAAANPQ